MKWLSVPTIGLALLASVTPTQANVVTDWDDIAVKTIQPSGPMQPISIDLTFRASAMVNAAMFDAVNCIEPKYQSYKMQMEPSPDTSRDAAAATAAANVLMKMIPNSTVKQQLADYLAKIPDGPTKERGIKVGEEVATKIVEMRARDGSAARNAYRPVTQPGQYIPTAFTGGVVGGRSDPLRLGQSRPIPSRTAARSQERDLGERLQ